MEDDESESDGQPGGGRGTALAGRIEDDQGEQERRDEFAQDRGPHPIVLPTGLSEARGQIVGAALALQDHHEDAGTDQPPDQLRDDVGDGVLGSHPSGDPHGHRHRRIDVGSGDWSEAIGHRHHGQPEGECDR